MSESTITEAIRLVPGRNEIEVFDTARLVSVREHDGEIVVVAIGDRYSGVSRQTPIPADRVQHLVHVVAVGEEVPLSPGAYLGTAAYQGGLYCVFDGNRL